jgi:putative transposase
LLRKVVKVRLYLTHQPQIKLAQIFGPVRWWWNYTLNKSIETDRQTGKGLSQSALKALLSALKKAEKTSCLGACYSQALQAATLNLTAAYKNFFDRRAGFPKFKSKKGKQSAKHPQNVKVLDGIVKLPGNVGEIKAKTHRLILGTFKTVTACLVPSGKYWKSVLFEVEGENPTTAEGEIYGIDLGLKHFAAVTDGEKVSKYDNPKHIAKYEKNLKLKQQKLARKKSGSNSRHKSRKIVAKVYEQVANSQQNFLYKLGHKLLGDRQAVKCGKSSWSLRVVRNRHLAKARLEAEWSMFTNFLASKLERKGGKLVERGDRWFPSSQLCSNGFYQIPIG